VDAIYLSVQATAASHGERILCGADAGHANTCDCLSDLFSPMGIGGHARVATWIITGRVRATKAPSMLLA
jgi:hypothetical protein